MPIGQLTGCDGSGVGLALYETIPSTGQPPHSLGFEATDGFGQYYRFVRAGAGGALVAGNVVTGAAEITAHATMVPLLTTYTAAIGATQLQVTLGAAAVLANQYAGGSAVIDTSTGIGQTLLIAGHPAADSGATLVITLGQPLRVALASGSRITFAPNAYAGLIQAPATTLTGAVAGVATYVIGASEWGWIGTGGVHGTLGSGTIIVGAAVVSPSGTAGAVVADPANVAVDIVAVAMVTCATGEVNPMKWFRR